MPRVARSRVRAQPARPSETAYHAPLPFRLLASAAYARGELAPTIAKALHGALVSALPANAAPGLVRPDDHDLQLAVIPLVNGRVVSGIGLALPRTLLREAREQLRNAIGRVRADGFGGHFRIELDRHLPLDRWVGPARTWRSITPYLSTLRARDTCGTDRCDRLRYDLAQTICPEAPDGVTRMRDAIEHLSIEDAQAAPGTGPGGTSEEVYVRFASPLRGPLMIGHERHRGLGLLVPTR